MRLKGSMENPGGDRKAFNAEDGTIDTWDFVCVCECVYFISCTSYVTAYPCFPPLSSPRKETTVSSTSTADRNTPKGLITTDRSLGILLEVVNFECHIATPPVWLWVPRDRHYATQLLFMS
ncbi:hypothetical protein E2C01_018072 [Portunus trituberculatus]|uniref:Uncharacterized protein n=1 Tax=Portunus trituberculatus TaxID=210409 RepID=A0A5B7DV76_PORTR|nr:hypothetical protein [Portunus trituberculatus]